eukprot:gene34394-35308_t
MRRVVAAVVCCASAQVRGGGHVDDDGEPPFRAEGGQHAQLCTPLPTASCTSSFGKGDCVAGSCRCDAGFAGPSCADAEITKVHLIQSCHLDVGFTSTSASVVNTYLSHHIPQAIASANALRNNSNGWRVRFMAQSYYLSFYLDCPPNMGFTVIPVLKRNGVDLVSVGVNGASMYPRVPKIFRWQDPALVTDWIGDNAGPGNPKHYLGVFAQIQKEFPKATIVASTFDEWLDAVDQSGLREKLPVVASEVGDSWIYGVPSDPKKTSQARALDRALTRYLEAGGEQQLEG